MARFRAYTRSGDDGTTYSPALGAKVPKDHPTIEVSGALDEAVSAIGLARSLLPPGMGAVDAELSRVQRLLFSAVTEFLTGGRRRLVSESDVRWLEEVSDSRMVDVELFVMPSGHPASAAVHMARAYVRRLERVFVRAAREEGVDSPIAMALINRASSALFALALYINSEAGFREDSFRP